MAQQIYQYYEAALNRNRGVIELGVDPMKLALVKSSYTPNLDLHKIWTVTTEWEANTTYNVGDRVVRTSPSGKHYVCTVGGESGSSEPSWNNIEGEETTDNEVTWEAVVDVGYHEVLAGDGYPEGGKSLNNITLSRDNNIITLDADDVTFAALTKTFRYGVLYIDDAKTYNGESIVKPLYAYILFDDSPADVEVNGTDYVVQWSSNGISRFGPTSALCS